MGKIIVANWKLNPATEAEAEKLAKESDVEGLIICPPFPFLRAVAKVIKKAKLGAQDLSNSQLKDLCVEYVIIGHSDRRKLGETDEMVAKKIAAALKDGLKSILCVGETRAERDSGKAKEVVEREVRIGLSLTNNLKLKTKNLIVAYEPIWAIGTGNPDTPENMLEMVRLIKGERMIYGGSVTSKNAEDFLKHKEISGALVGAASLDSAEIRKIVKIASKYSAE